MCNSSQKIEEDFRRITIQQDKIKKEDKKVEEDSKSTVIDIQGIKARARANSRAAPASKVSIAHLGRVSKNKILYETNRQFQLNYDFEGLAREIKLEKDNIYVSHEAHQLLKNAKNTSLVKHQNKHRYLSRDEHIERIRREKSAEEKRRK